jgi:biopolymer transport protein TolQ
MLSLLASVDNPESVFFYFFKADGLGKGIVVILMACSVAAWYVMIDKFLEVRKALESSERLLRDMDETSSHLVFTGRLAQDPSPIARIHEAGSAALLKILATDAETLVIHADDHLLPRALTSIEFDAVRKAVDHKVDELELNYSSGMPVLGTLVYVSPYIGLLGTVYGIMLAFGGMTVNKSADISAIAPGVAGALLCTTAGLLVAIPSIVGLNMLKSRMKRVMMHMYNYSDSFMSNLSLHRVRKHHGA